MAPGTADSARDSVMRVLERARTDTEFHRKVKEDPAKALREAGVPASMTANVRKSTKRDCGLESTRWTTTCWWTYTLW
jgi:hypothetical protein